MEEIYIFVLHSGASKRLRPKALHKTFLGNQKKVLKQIIYVTSPLYLGLGQQ